MSEEKQKAKERRYAVLSKETVRLFAESAGYANLPDEVTEVLAEDLSYRLRDLIQQSSEFMKHSKRRKMVAKDFTSALRNSDIQPIFGHSFPEPLTFRQTKEAEIFFYDDAEINLASIALAPFTPTQTGKTTAKVTWMAVEGVRTGSCLAQASTQGKPYDRGPRPLSEDSLLYFDMITKAILGTDEEPMKAALKDLCTNPNLLPLLPYLVNFVANGVRTVSHDTAQLGRLLHTIKALVTNPSIYLEPKPYLTMLIQTIEYCMIEPLTASINPQNDHWMLRDYAAHLLGLTTWKWNTEMNQLKQLKLKALREVLLDTGRPFCSHYGAVVGILALGLQAAHDIILPLLSSYWNHLEEALSDCSYANALIKADAQKVSGALLLVADFIVRGHISRLKSSVNSLKEVHLPNHSKLFEEFQQEPHFNPIDLDRDRFIDGELPGAVVTLPDNMGSSSSQTFSRIYSQLYECFGDSLSAHLPITAVPDFYLPRREPVPVTFSDADTAKTGEELLQQFLVHPSGVKRTASEKDVNAGNRSPEDMDVDEKSNPSVWSAHSSHSYENLSYVAEDTDLTIKATVSDPSHGIKLTILKRPKTKEPTLTNSQSLATPIVTDVHTSKASPPVNKPLVGRKSSIPKLVRTSEMFELMPMRQRDVIFVFSFQGRVQHCVFSERQKALILARDMAQQHAAVSKYRTMCSCLPYFGKRKKPSSVHCTLKPCLFRAPLDLNFIL